MAFSATRAVVRADDKRSGPPTRRPSRQPASA